MKTPKVPTYGLHKPTGQARCYIHGKSYYLGKYGTEESRIKFGELVAKIVSGQPIDPFAGSKVGSTTCPEAGLTIHELVLAFMRHADGHYLKNGKPTSEIHCLKSATRPLIDVYGFTAVDSFGPMMLKAVRHHRAAEHRTESAETIGRGRSGLDCDEGAGQGAESPLRNGQ